MPSVLVVDDETGYREMLGEHLTSRGFEVQTAANGRGAIDLGVRYRPDVLVTDWMLKNRVHGLHVSDVLQVVNPGMQTVLITGFPSGDLKADAREKGVFDFIEKPFEPEDLEHSVHNAASADAPAERKGTIGVLEVDANGSILFVNPVAKELLDKTSSGRRATSFSDIFSPDDAPDLDAAVDHWITATPSSDDAIVWQLRARKPHDDGSRMVVLRRRHEGLRPGNAVIDMLLGYRDSDRVIWPFEGLILLVDDNPRVRRMSVTYLEGAGAGCYVVATPPEALRLLESDDGLKYVVHDFDIEPFDTAESIRSIQAARPDVLIVGTSGSFHRGDFAALDVDHYLPKPWTVKELIDVLLGRIGDCGECGLTLPLRWPKPGEQASSWVCAFCGSCYRAVRDDTVPEDVLRNARRSEE